MGIDLNRFRGRRSDQDWLDWLADDPVPGSIRSRIRQKAVQDASRPVRRSATRPIEGTSSNNHSNGSGNKTVSIHISLPDTRKLRALVTQAKREVLKRKPSRRTAVAAGSAMAALVILVGVIVLIRKDDQGSNTTDGSSVLSQSSAKPDFEYSLPKGKDSEVEQAVKYDATKKVVNFVDSIGGVQITVSQQPLPAGFEENTQDKVQKLAEDFSATHPLTTATPTAYLGTDSKGPQTVIFTKKKLLVFIQSANKIDDHDWAEYITNLK